MQKRGFFGVVRRIDFVYRLDVLFYASVAAPAILFLLGIGKYHHPNSLAQPLAIFPEWFSWILIICIICSASLGIFLYKRRIKDAQKQVTLRWKVQRFLRAVSFKYTLPAFSGTFAALCYYLTGQGMFALVVMTILILLTLERPTLKKVSQELALEGEGLTLFKSNENWNI